MDSVTPEGLIKLLHDIEDRCRISAQALPKKDDVQHLWEGIVFTISGFRLIAPLSEVREILNYPTVVTSIPGTLAWMRGIANIRGNLLPIIDLQAFFGGEPIRVARRSRVLVIDYEGVFSGLLVEDVYGIRHFPEEFRVSSGSLAGSIGDFVDGSFVVEGESWPVFSMENLAISDSFQDAAA